MECDGVSDICTNREKRSAHLSILRILSTTCKKQTSTGTNTRSPHHLGAPPLASYSGKPAPAPSSSQPSDGDQSQSCSQPASFSEHPPLPFPMSSMARWTRWTRWTRWIRWTRWTRWPSVFRWSRPLSGGVLLFPRSTGWLAITFQLTSRETRPPEHRQTQTDTNTELFLTGRHPGTERAAATQYGYKQHSPNNAPSRQHNTSHTDTTRHIRETATLRPSYK